VPQVRDSTRLPCSTLPAAVSCHTVLYDQDTPSWQTHQQLHCSRMASVFGSGVFTSPAQHWLSLKRQQPGSAVAVTAAAGGLVDALTAVGELTHCRCCPDKDSVTVASYQLNRK
jgi:hypothetical protein